ncbi:SNARE sec72 [Schizosaccharomyces japonicus yFS275]|uniref:SNARE sec72 n=1 Tax=Schizosaccharomyces japonicus (strain yFS275 / FY16936) TaxID=402676 RepID=B6JXA1_SCHJY|nr:SNARE sec72 [Schizosaccharomyces japonicus yFS275]EEB06002.1 SNARE sec72 [Schizosaccharomyces japonicus yFS275]
MQENSKELASRNVSDHNSADEGSRIHQQEKVEMNTADNSQSTLPLKSKELEKIVHERNEDSSSISQTTAGNDQGEMSQPQEAVQEEGQERQRAETKSQLSDPKSALPADSLSSDAARKAAGEEVLEKQSISVIKNYVDQLLSIRACQKNGDLMHILKNVKASFTPPKSVDKIQVVEMLQTAFLMSQDSVLLLSLDTIAKLAGSAYFRPTPNENDTMDRVLKQKKLIDIVVGLVCDCIHNDVVDGALQLNVVKALTALAMCERPVCYLHGSALLNTIRKVYNIFLVGDDDSVQSVAQASLFQIIDAVFERAELAHRDVVDAESDIANMVVSNGSSTEVSLDTMAKVKPVPVNEVTPSPSQSATSSDLSSLLLQDAFLVTRSMSRLSVKHASLDKAVDVRSQSMRSKLISLYLLYHILSKHITLFSNQSIVFTDVPSLKNLSFLSATRQYLCLALSKNAVSPIPQVFKVCINIFWVVLSSLRTFFIKEIEVFLHEVYLPILEMRNTSYNQKYYTLLIFQRICSDARVLVELYLNYDCDGNCPNNLFEQILGSISKIATYATHDVSSMNDDEIEAVLNYEAPTVTPFLNTNSVALSADIAQLTTYSDNQLKLKALECIVFALRSLVSWAENGMQATKRVSTYDMSTESYAEQATAPMSASIQQKDALNSSNLSLSSTGNDDPMQFESNKQKKKLLQECIWKFNYKPQAGIRLLAENGFVNAAEPKELAQFLKTTEGINKAALGEYLGGGDDANIATMHAFVDLFNFNNVRFVDAMRDFLQAFRLPGEGQKIDRFMLKFSERYMEENEESFATADTAYILAYSIIMLNTDLHSPQVKNRMSKQEFIKNNRGINDGNDLDEAFLSSVYDDILNNEIVMKDEQEMAALAPLMLGRPAASGFASAFAALGRDLQREAYIQASEELAKKTASVLKKVMHEKKRSDSSYEIYYSASHFEHISPMLEATWMPILATLSSPLQVSEYENELLICTEGFKLVIRIACLFDLDLIRDAFIKTLLNFTSLEDFSSLQKRHVHTIRTLLTVALTEGNLLRSSWTDILTMVSKLERMQLITVGVNEDDVPDVSRIKSFSRKSTSSGRRGSTANYARSIAKNPPTLLSEASLELSSSETVKSIDKIFTQTSSLSGTAIVDFFKALCDVAWEEIESSYDSDQPRLFSLQKLVEISYYNMKRIRVEWSAIWNVLGSFFNRVASYKNLHVSTFALDSLRQLSMQFLDMEELSHFNFQKEFLKPFEYVMSSDANFEVKELVIHCVRQMIQAKITEIKSGWKTLFGVFTFAAKQSSLTLVKLAFETVKHLYDNYFEVMLSQGCFVDILVTLTEFCKNGKFQVISFQSLELIQVLNKSLKEYGVDKATSTNALDKYYFPVMFAYYDIIMSAEDLEVRSKALKGLFRILFEDSESFSAPTWEIVCKKYVFPIFDEFPEDTVNDAYLQESEELSAWHSATMVEALKNVVELFTKHFDKLHGMTSAFFHLFCTHICQDYATISRAATSCLQQLLTNNASKFSESEWRVIIDVFAKLFADTTPSLLLDEESILGSHVTSHSVMSPAELEAAELHSKSASEMEVNPRASLSSDIQVQFRSTTRKCVLHLLLISVLVELLDDPKVFKHIPVEQLLRVTSCIHDSWKFAHVFNENKKLRVALLNAGFMKQLPNLLRQETAGALAYCAILFRLLNEERTDMDEETKKHIEKLLFPFCHDILRTFVELPMEKHARNHAIWQSVLAVILKNMVNANKELFQSSVAFLFKPCCDILMKEHVEESLRALLRSLFLRVGSEFIGEERLWP